MKEFDRLPPPLENALGGDAFRRRARLVLPLVTVDPDGSPRAAYLTAAEVRATSPTDLVIAVGTGTRTAVNLIRRRQATLLYLHRSLVASVIARAGRARICEQDPEKRIFPLRIERVRLDQPPAEEGGVLLRSGPVFGGADAKRLFSPELFDELGRLSR